MESRASIMAQPYHETIRSASAAIPITDQQERFFATRDHPQSHGEAIARRACRPPGCRLPHDRGESHDPGRGQRRGFRQGAEIHLHPHQHEEQRCEHGLQRLNDTLDRDVGLLAVRSVLSRSGGRSRPRSRAGFRERTPRSAGRGSSLGLSVGRRHTRGAWFSRVLG